MRDRPTQLYQAVRAEAMHFAVLSGHEGAEWDHVLARTGRDVAVKKVGAGEGRPAETDG